MSTSTHATGRNTRRIKVHSSKLSPKVLTQMASDLAGGAVAIFPTETVYGIGTSVFSPSGIRRIYALKGRGARKPLALLVASLEAARPLVETIPAEALGLAKRFWPGPLTLVLKASPLGRLITGGLATIGVRIPDHPIALSILRKAGIPLAVTSVNRSGHKPAVSGAACAKLFGSRVDWLIDAGTCRVQKASSVIDLSHYPYTVIRDGAIPKRQLEKALWPVS
jgi:L-threonylcarbamoyladenylate synthase